MKLPVGPDQFLMFDEHFFDGEDVLLALVGEGLILCDEAFDELIEGVYFFYIDEGHILDKHGEFFLLRQESRVSKIGHQFIAPVLLFVPSYLVAIRPALFQH